MGVPRGAQRLIGSLGMADTALWDERGRIGRAVQTLLVRPRASTASRSA